MNKQSIFFTLTVSFIISLVLVIGSFFVILTHDYKIKENQLFDKYIPVIKMVTKRDKRPMNPEFLKNLEEMDLILINEISKINAITYNPQTKVIVERIHPSNRDIFRVLTLNNITYVYVKRAGKTLLIQDKAGALNNSQLYIFLIFFTLLSTIILIYIINLKKLIPLKVLKDKVKTLGDENFDFECCNANGKDEVSLLAQEFKKSATKLKNLKEARNIFIRNIMHELKTPITKGKFLTSLEQNEENNEKLKSVFNRLESLINEFASIEELISSSKNIDKKNYFLDDIVDNAKDILMVDDEFVVCEYENKKLEINYKLFSIALKNLIDNGIKYSTDKKVTIKNSDLDIIFENSGEALKYPLENYFEPFFSNENRDSFGLGLYIVHNILRANGYSLVYEYEDGLNRFICKKDELSTI